jgi:integrase
MGLYRRGPTWWISFTYKGQQVRQSTETDDRKLAEKIYHKVMTEVVEGKWFQKPVGEAKTFGEMMERYMKEHSARNKAPKSHERDKSLLAHLLSHFGTLRLSELCPRIVSEYKVQRRTAGAKPKTINNELTLMNHALNLCVKEWEWLRVNPVGKVSKEKVNNKIDRWLRPDEEKRLRDASRSWLWEIILFAMSTGLRQGDIINLKWDQVDLSRRTLYISAEQKNKDIDTLPLNATATGVLTARSRVHQIPEGYVFLNRDGGKINARNLLRSFYAACDKAKVIKFRFHDLRHIFATRLVHAGVDLYTVQKLGRWKSISMVERYAHHCPESLRPGVEVLDKIITNLSQSPETATKKGSRKARKPLNLFGCGGKI